MEDDELEDDYYHSDIDDLKIPQSLRADWFIVLISLQADLIYNALLVLTSPIAFFLSLVHHSYRRAAATATATEKAVKQAPSRVTHGVARVVRRTWFGVLGACHVSMVLVVAMTVAAVVGVGLVGMYAEEPVAVREKLFFDYTEVNPRAVFCFEKKKPFGVPVGHSIHVTVVILVPESDYNRDIGLFQLSAEILSSKGDAIVKSSQPCMLTYRSLPIRLARTLAMSVPLVVGLSSDTQKMKIDVLRHKERHDPRTRGVRVTLLPRARTLSLPQLYEAEILIMSKQPWMKRFIYSWKWTLCVWTSFCLYAVLLVALLCFCRPFLFPVSRASVDVEVVKARELMEGSRKGREEVMRRWRGKRSTGKASISMEALS